MCIPGTMHGAHPEYPDQPRGGVLLNRGHEDARAHAGAATRTKSRNRGHRRGCTCHTLHAVGRQELCARTALGVHVHRILGPKCPLRKGHFEQSSLDCTRPCNGHLGAMLATAHVICCTRGVVVRVSLSTAYECQYPDAVGPTAYVYECHGHIKLHKPMP